MSTHPNASDRYEREKVISTCLNWIDYLTSRGKALASTFNTLLCSSLKTR